MPKSTDDYFDRLAQNVQKRMDKSTDRLVEKLGPEITEGDAGNISKADWYALIRTHWADPEWRAKEGFRMGATKLVRDALYAHGLDPNLLKQNAEAIVLGIPHPVDATDELAASQPQPPQEPTL